MRGDVSSVSIALYIISHIIKERMTIETYDFPQLTQVSKDVFPVKSCNGLFCANKFDFSMLSKVANLSTGFLMGNDYAVKQAKTLGMGRDAGGSGSSIEDEDDFSSPSKYLYYNTDIRYP